MNRPEVPAPRLAAAHLALLCLAALLGNLCRLHLFYNIEVLFGSVFALVAVARFGLAGALSAGGIAALATVFFWGHPWSFVVFFLEPLFVALFQRRNRGNIVLADTLFWLVAGMPLVFLFYRIVLGFPFDTVLLIALKESGNGLFNALLATLLLHGWAMLRRSDDPHRVPVPLREIVFTALVAAALLPAMVELVHDVAEYIEERESTTPVRVMKLKVQNKINDQLLFLWGSVLLILPISRLLSSRLASSIHRLRLVTAQLPADLGEREISWPVSNIRELQELGADFRAVGEALNTAFRELTTLNQTLEERVEERTRELQKSSDLLRELVREREAAEEALALKQRQLSILNRSLEERVAQEVAKSREKDQLLITQSRQAAMGEMIGNIAHQWRQPLNALGLLLANIEDAFHYRELDEPFLTRTVAEGNRLVQKMSKTISDFRNFFRPDRELTVFSARAQIEEALSLVQSSFGDDRIEISVEGAEDLRLSGFPNQFSQVLLNLLANAREAIRTRSDEGGRVAIALSREGENGVITLCDSGGGIPDEVLPRVFEPYFSTKKGGSGIGLYMSKMIIERNMKGRLEARNLEGGAELAITVPLAPEGA